MVVYKTILPVIQIGVTQTFPPEYLYGLVYEVQLDQTYSEVYLRSIRFVIAYDNEADLPLYPEGQQAAAMSFPYQIHLKWLDASPEVFQPGLVVQNTMDHDISGGKQLRQPPFTTAQTASYSTFCTCMSSFELPKKQIGANPSPFATIGPTRCLVYDMTRNALLRTGAIRHLHFEVFFTDFNGDRYYRYLPNVEIEFELV